MATVVNPNGDMVTVGQLYAAMYWGFVVSTSFVGISLVQGYLYFMRNNKDRWTMKALVISLLLFDSATSLLMAGTIYQYFILNFGVAKALEEVPTTWVIENGFTVLVTAIVQIFFASRVYVVNSVVDVLPLGRTAPALVFVFALLAFAAGTVRTIFIGVWSMASFSRNSFQTFMTIEETFSLMSDLLSSACLCYILAPPCFGSMKRSETLKTMFMFTINRAILMSFVQIGMLVSYLSAKDGLYWMPFQLCKSKLYTNTLLAMLNSRSGGSFQSQTPSRPLWSMPAIDLTVWRSVFSPERDVEKAAVPREDVEPENHLPNIASPGPS